MSTEVLPVGVTCNLRCDYCYEQPEREKQAVHKYNREAVLEGIKTATQFWQLFGGEPLLIRIEDLEELLKAGHDRWGYTGLQTNGTLITPKHIELFVKYKTQVGISIDGPNELNDSRWAGTLEATRKATARSEWAIEEIARVSRETNNPNLGPTLIVTLHSGNVSQAVLPQFEQWLRYLDAIGCKFINFHFLEIDHKASKWDLSDDDLTRVMSRLRELSAELKNLKFLNFNELENLLVGDSNKAMCVWHSCDAWSTSAVQGLNNVGEPSNCTRGTKDGIAWLPAEGSGDSWKWGIGPEFMTNRFHERQLALYVTPEEHGGCKGCRFWLMCTGYCPGTGLQVADIRGTSEKSDWRTKSSHCRSLKAQFTEMEEKLVSVGQTPVSLRPERAELEAFTYDRWSQGKDCTLGYAIWAYENKDKLKQNSNSSGSLSDRHTDIPHGDHHGDHTDAIPHGDQIPEPLNVPHGDHTDIIPHGDHIDSV